MPKEISDHIPLFTMSKKNPVLDQNLSLIIKTSKSCHLNVANCPRDTESKKSPRHLNFMKQLKKTTEMKDAHNNQKFGHIPSLTFFFKSTTGSWEKKKYAAFSSLWLRNFHFYPRCARWESVEPANKTSPRFYPEQTSAAFPSSPSISILRDSDIVLSKLP